jgi:hypothetical protein
VSFSISEISKNSELTLYLRIKFYVDDPLLLANTQTRHLYYMQLKQNYLTTNNKLNDEKYFQIASLALVAEFGPFEAGKHVDGYFDPSSYFPHWVGLTLIETQSSLADKLIDHSTLNFS